MSSFTTQAIILNRRDFSEADRLLTILSLDRGLMKVLAKGARKPLSKTGSFLELFCEVEVSFSEGRNFDLVSDVKTLSIPKKIRGDVGKTNAAEYVAEIIMKCIQEHEPHPEIYALLRTSLSLLSELPAEALVIETFLLNFLKLTGYELNVERCQVCDTLLKEEQNYISEGYEGILCPKHQTPLSLPLSSVLLKTMRYLLKHPLDEAVKLRIAESEHKQLTKITTQMMSHRFEQEFSASQFV